MSVTLGSRNGSRRFWIVVGFGAGSVLMAQAIASETAWYRYDATAKPRWSTAESSNGTRGTARKRIAARRNARSSR